MQMYRVTHMDQELGRQVSYCRNMAEVDGIITAQQSLRGPLSEHLSTDSIKVPTRDKTAFIEWLNAEVRNGNE